MQATRWLVIVLVLAWVALGIDSLRVATAPATGDGFTRGMDRAMAVLLRQLGAVVLAAAVWALGRQLPPGAMRRASLVPLVAEAVLGLTVVIATLVVTLR